MIRATLVYIFIGAYVLLVAPCGLLWTWWSHDASLLFRLARRCLGVAGWLAGIRVVVEGREHLDSARTCLFLSNHRSNCDGPVLLWALGRDLRALIKQEIMRLPLLAPVLRVAGFVPLDRRNPQQARQGIERGTQMLRDGISFFAFPEGTRSRDGRLGAFKKGAFIMAIQAQTPVVPVTISGSAAIQPPGRYGLRPGTIHILVHPPIATAGMTFDDRNTLIQTVHALIASSIPA